MEEYIAKIVIFGFSWIPRNYKACDGTMVSVSSNTTLFSLLGTNFGGDGRTTFGLPDLRGRVIIGQGQEPGLTYRQFGQKLGSENNTLTVNNLPTHNHTATLNLTNNSTTIKVSTQAGVTKTAGANSKTLGSLVSDVNKIYNDAAPDFNLNVDGNTVEGTVEVDNSGLGQAVNNMQPSLVLNPCIVTNGLYPSRN